MDYSEFVVALLICGDHFNWVCQFSKQRTCSGWCSKSKKFLTNQFEDLEHRPPLTCWLTNLSKELCILLREMLFVDVWGCCFSKQFSEVRVTNFASVNDGLVTNFASVMSWIMCDIWWEIKNSHCERTDLLLCAICEIVHRNSRALCLKIIHTFKGAKPVF